MEASVKNKEEVYKEIKGTLKFLLKERERGNEEFELQDFFNDELAENIVGNFDGKISVKEYETCILDLFGLKKIDENNISLDDVEEEIERLIKNYNIKSKSLIFDKIYNSLNKPEDLRLGILDIIDKKYAELVSKKSKKRILEILDKGLLNTASILKVLERDGYDLDEKMLKVLIKEQKKIRQTEILTRRPVRKVNKSRQLATQEKEKKAKEQLRQTIIRKEKNKKDRFIGRYTRGVKFTLKEQASEGKNKLTIHVESFQGKEIRITSFLIGPEVVNVKLEIRPQIMRQKSGIEFDVNNYINIEPASKKSAFFQKAVKLLSSMLGYQSVQEGIWLLTNILTPGKKLPPKTCQYLNKHFTSQLKELDAKIAELIIERSVK